jgi:DNA-binding NarL/FixJ family response regulator
VTVISCANDVDHLRASVILSVVDDPPALSHTDLRVVGALVEGWPVARIAAALGVTTTAVEERVRRVSATIGALSVSALVFRALRQGMYIPANPADLAGRSPAGLTRSRTP